MVADRELQDTTVADEVARALAWTTANPVTAVVSTVCQGWVTLSGIVEDEQQRYAAERAVRHIAGVQGITNIIGIRALEAPAPRVVSLAERIALTV